MQRSPLLLVIVILLILGAANIYHRHVHIGVPLTPGEEISLWQVEAEITFEGQDGPATAHLSLPEDPAFELVQEFTASPAYGVNVVRSENKSEVVWSKRSASGDQVLYYQGLFKSAGAATKQSEPPLAQSVPDLDEPYKSAAEAVLRASVERSGNDVTLVNQVLNLMASDDQNIGMLRSQYSDTETFVLLMQVAGIPVRQARGLVLEDGRRNQSLIPLAQVYLNKNWQLKNVESTLIDQETPLLIWLSGDKALLDVEGGRESDIRFAISEQRVSALQEVRSSLGKQEGSWTLGLYNLPVAEQNLFKGILLLPLGALVVVFMRVLIGLRSSGTFMPILIAAAFIQTELLNGLVGFISIVAIGLMIRSLLSYFNLLLVSRISAVVVVVIGLILLFTVVAFQLGLTDALTITFFPMIILAWTIERMSILWEEEGGREVLIQGGGSLLIAVLAYLIMDNSFARHFAFNFLGVHALILAAILMMGQYTGYRLLELRRFAPLSGR